MLPLFDVALRGDKAFHVAQIARQSDVIRHERDRMVTFKSFYKHCIYTMHFLFLTSVVNCN